MDADSADTAINHRRPTDRFAHLDLTERVIGVFYDVYNELRTGFLESVYREALAIGLEDAGLHVEREVGVALSFRGRNLTGFRLDLVVESRLVVELKAAERLTEANRAQLVNYLRATRFELGLLLGFCTRPQIRRVAFDNSGKRFRFLRSQMRPEASL